MLALLHAWVVLPLVLVALTGGLGLLVDRLAGGRTPGLLVLPVGFAALIVVGAIVTSASALAPAAAPLAAVLGLAGLVLGRGRVRGIPRSAVLAALGAFLALGAPVLLSGQATFAGYVKLDDTATWLAFSDLLTAHGRSTSGLPDSTYALLTSGNIGQGYPLGAYVPLGIGRILGFIDAAWAFGPLLALCGALTALCAYALLEPLVPSRRVRAVLAFVAAQPALLYGYVQWGGIKEVTLALLVMLAAAVAVPVLRSSRAGARDALPLAVVCGALAATVGPGAIVWVGPVLAVVAATWLWRARADDALRRALLRLVVLGVGVLVLSLPMLLILGRQITYTNLFSSSTAPSAADLIGNLYRPLDTLQLGGIWPVSDFRVAATSWTTTPLLVLVGLAALGTVVWSARRRRPEVVLYAALALCSYAVAKAGGATPWLLGKSMAIASPAVPLLALAGAGLLWTRSRRAGSVVLVLLAGGVLWSNVLAYRDTPVAPHDRFADLAHIGGLVEGAGPTFDNEYEVYATRHFLRRGAPVSPAEYRTPLLALRDGAVLTKAAYADLDAFPVATLLPYRSIVLTSSPTASRPPSIYREVWRGRYYRLYQRSAVPTERIVEHVAYGDSGRLPYCGNAQIGTARALCPVQPLAQPTCASIRALGRRAASVGGTLVAAERTAPVVIRGDQMQWPASWLHDQAARTLTPTGPGQAVAQIAVATSGTYDLWLGGSFGRGFDVSVDGRDLGLLHDERGSIGTEVPFGSVRLSAGTHRFAFSVPSAGLRPGAVDSMRLTTLGSVALALHDGRERLVRAPADQADALCGTTLDWLEIVV